MSTVSSITMPTATVDPTFENLLKISLRRNYPASIFFKLFKDFKSRLENGGKTIDSSPLFISSDENHLQRDYIYEVLVGADLQNTCEEFINYFSNITRIIDITDQISILLYINQIENKFPWKIYTQNLQVLDSLADYSKYLMSPHDNSNDDFSRLLFLFVKLVNKIFQNSNNIKLSESFINQIKSFSNWLNLNSFKEINNLLQSQLSAYNVTLLKLGFIKNENINEIKPDKPVEKESVKSFQLKKIIWLTQKFTIEFIKLDNQFLIDFKKLLNLSNVSTLESMSNLIIELLSSIFQCLQLSSSNSLHTWRNYIIFQIPLFFKNILKINQFKLEKILMTLFDNNTKFINDFRDILIAFENFLIELELLKPNILKFSTEKFPQKLEFTPDELNHNYTHKFLECNPEFTSIEEIGIPEFLNKINKSINLRLKFCELSFESINSFISTGDTLRLRRLLISCSVDFDLLDNLILFNSPYKVLMPLLKFLDDRILQLPGTTSSNMSSASEYPNQLNQPDIAMDLDVGNDDSSNIQEFLGDICFILIFVKLLIKRYNILIKSDELFKISNIASLLKNSRLLINRQTASIDEIKIDDITINKWISSMFDSSNIDGISDDLIKICAPIDYSILIPKIVHEAIISNSIGWLDNDSLNGGLEYLHQKFLIGWLIYVINDLCKMNWETNEQVIHDVLDRVLKQLLEIKKSESLDIQISIKLIKIIMNDKIVQNFPHFDSDMKINKQPSNLSDIENISNLITFISSSDKNKLANNSKLNFDMNKIWSFLLSNQLNVDYLFNILIQLKNNSNFNHTSLDLNYDVISLLLVTFAKWIAGENIGKTWPKALSEINNSNTSFPNSIFNRKTSKNATENSTQIKAIKTESNVNTEDYGFFGFIQDPPKLEDSNMQIDLDSNTNSNSVKIENGSENNDESQSITDNENASANENMEENAEKNVDEDVLDIYLDNLLVIAYEKKGDKTTEAFIRRILDYLN